MKCDIFETYTLKGYTCKYRVRLDFDVCFNLPGRGGNVTKKAANKVVMLWNSGKSVKEIIGITGFNIVN